MADTGELKEVKKVLIGPLLANNPITLQVPDYHQLYRDGTR